jgi:NAD(P)-dependent dehydrogenase (short-subunit alcohol dehydrogenase family)
MNTILITGCSSGFGLETAKYFLEREWKVVATMRTPREDVLPTSKNLRVLKLDVTDPSSIRQALHEAGPLDALVNNAGFGGASPAELTPMDSIRKIFETNTFGTFAVTQAVLPLFRERQAGVLVNVTSSVTLKPLPLLSAYRAAKSAVNAYTESVAVEMADFGVRVHLVLPGQSPDTSFATNAQKHIAGVDNPVYASLFERVFARLRNPTGPLTKPLDVAEAIWFAVTDPSAPQRIPAGADAKEWAAVGTI